MFFLFTQTPDDTGHMADGDLETIQARHKKEIKSLTAQITALKKSATKGDKAKKKEVLAEIEKLEKETRDRHDRELRECESRGINGSDDPDTQPRKEVSGDQLSVEDDTLPDTLNQLELNGYPTPNGKTKPNRQKARLVTSIYDLADPIDETGR
jgi:OTU domain-containing protein 6